MKTELSRKKEINTNNVYDRLKKSVILISKKLLSLLKKAAVYIKKHWQKITFITVTAVLILTVLLFAMLKNTTKSEIDIQVSDTDVATVIPLYPGFDTVSRAYISVILSWTDGAIDLNDGTAQARIKAKVYPITVKDQTITWSSTDESIASIDENGNITASSPGKVRINAVLNSEHIGASATLSVRQPASGIFLKTTSLTIALNGESKPISAQVLPENATNQNILFSSKDTKVATVDASGNVTPVGVGMTEITAVSEDGGFSGKCFVTVINSTVEPEKVEIQNAEALQLKAGESANLSAVVSPSNAKNKTLKWSSDNTDIVSVSQTGRVKGVSAGTANVTVQTHNGKTASLSVEVAAADNHASSDLNTVDSQTNTSGTVTYTSYSISLMQAVQIQMMQDPPPKIWQASGSIFASEIETAQYMNPNNYYQGSYKYQFLDLSKTNNVTEERLNEYLAGKGVLSGKGAAFIEAAKKYNVSEVYLVAHACLESGNGTSQLASGVEVNGTTVYNVFGINAYDSDPVGSGSSRAYNEGWTSVEDAIIGGAGWISEHYINNTSARQNTLYKMRWNPENPGDHQYATDIQWAVEQAVSIEKIFAQFADSTLSFDVPVYDGQTPPTISTD